MVHSFFRKNKKKAIVSTVILSILALSVCVVCIYNSKILAGVFQSHKNDDGTISYVEKNTIEILEIIAQEGQQVLGYTVEGSEPIKPEQIQSYTGQIDHDEFLNATGYDVTGTPGNYTVNSSHNGAFNENVLSGMMYAENDVIEVNAVMASELTEDDIKKADLIYINNCADNDENLLYYYDQIVNNGKNGIAKGDKGTGYTGALEEKVSVREYAVDKICKAAGRRANAENLTADDFKKAELEKFYDYNISEYINGIAQLPTDSFKGNNTDESVAKINAALDTINGTLKGNARSVIQGYVKSGNVEGEDREKMIVAFKQGGYSNFYEVNAQDYIDYIVSKKAAGNDNKINSAMHSVNNNNYKSAIKVLKGIKDGEDYKGSLTDEEYTALVSKSIAQVLYDKESYNKLNADVYASKFLGDGSTYDTSANSNFANDLESKVVSVVNAEEKENALITLASLAADKAGTDNLKGDIAAADKLFKLSELENYKDYNVERYLDAIGNLPDAGALTSNQENEDGTWSEKYSVEKMNKLLDNVNNSLQDILIPCDIPWNVAMELYEYVTLNARALTYNTELLSAIGDFTQPGAENNSNSMYKFLLVLRQMTPDYFRSTVLPKIDADGNYDDGSGTVNGNWYAGTFCSDWNNEANADKHNFCEPAVVGNLYDTEGNVIGNASYIKENIYCFTGKEFFGGKDFYVDSEDYNKVVGKYEVTDPKYEYFTNKEWTTVVDNTYMLHVDVPMTTSKMYFEMVNPTWEWNNRTYDFDVSDCPSGTIVKLESGYGSKNNSDKKQYFNVDLIKPASPESISGNNKRIYIDMSQVGKAGDHYWTTGYKTNKVYIDYYEEQVITSEIEKTKGEVLREIMGISLNQLQSMPFKVLEIQPDGNVNELNSYEGAERLADYLRVDLPDMDQFNYKDYFEIESISVREFNTRHEELNGTYDLIYFGTKTKYMPTDGNGRTYYGDDDDAKTMGGDSMNGLVYTGMGQQRTVGGSLRGTVADDYSPASDRINYKNDHKIWTKYFFAEFSGPGQNALDPNAFYALKATTDVKTRMTGNDITVLRMDDLLDYVKSGYPILFAEGILDDESSDEKELPYVDRNSKFYNFIQEAKKLGKDASGEYTDTNAFKDGKAYASLVSVKYAKYGKNPDKLSANEKFNGGLCFAVKRNIQVDFKYIKGPQEYDRDINGNLLSASTKGNGVVGKDIGDSKRFEFILKPNIQRDDVVKWIESNYNFRLLVDKSGTANFEETQTAVLNISSMQFDSKKNEIKLAGRWPIGSDGGFIPWKLVVENKYNPGNRWVHVGYSLFPKKQETVNVLWVKAQASDFDPDGPKNGTTLDFKKMIEKYQSYIRDYEIKIDTINYTDFLGKWPKAEAGVYNKSNSLLKVGVFDDKLLSNSHSQGDVGKEYDMIVMGFCDSYAGLDLSNINCLNNIDYFVNKAGHSMLFAHDNASYITSFNYYRGDGRPSVGATPASFTTNFARYTTSFMRGMLGMDVFGSSYAPSAFSEGNTAEDKDYLSWLYRYTPSVYNARKYITNNPADPSTYELSDMRGYVDGQILWYSDDTDNWPIVDEKGNNIGKNSFDENWITTYGIECTNKGQITMYPFLIGDSLNIESRTHFQYTRLNLEDKDTTVWYTLSNSGGRPYYDATKGDGSNNYYIYSNGNITYTGAGHRRIDDDAVECFLFINTVVAAIKLGKFTPDVTFTEAISVNNEDVLYGYESDKALKVTFNATDYESDEGTKPFIDANIFLDKDGNGKYDKNSGDILLNTPAINGAAEGGAYLKNKDGASINFSGTDIINRTDMTFYLNFDELASLYDSINPLNNLKSQSDKVKMLFNTSSGGYKICISVLSQGEKNKADELGQSSRIIDYYQSASTKVILRALHNLR